MEPEELLNVNVIRDFSYTISSSSISYVRNYNFNPTTVTPINLTLINKNSVVPLTVDISASNPWMTIIDPVTNTSVVTPAGNVVLPRSSSKVVLIRLDLPADIEAIRSEVSVPVSMSFYIQSGSFPKTPSTSTSGTSGTNGTSGQTSTVEDYMIVVTSEVQVRPNASTATNVTFIKNGLPKIVEPSTITYDILNEDVAVIEQRIPEAGLPGNTLNTVVIRGVSLGETSLRIIKQPDPAPPALPSGATVAQLREYEEKLAMSRLPAQVKTVRVVVSSVPIGSQGTGPIGSQGFGTEPL